MGLLARLPSSFRLVGDLLVSDLLTLGDLLKLTQLTSDAENSRRLLSGGNLGHAQCYNILRGDLVARKLDNLVHEVLVGLARLAHSSLARLRDLSKHLLKNLDGCRVSAAPCIVDSLGESLSAGDVLLGHGDLLSEALRLRFWGTPFVPSRWVLIYSHALDL